MNCPVAGRCLPDRSPMNPSTSLVGLAVAVILATALAGLVLRVPLRGRVLAIAVASPLFLASVAAGAFCAASALC